MYLAGVKVGYKGRTFFTPAARFVFQKSLEQYVATHGTTHPDDALLANAKTLLDQLEQWDILSQSLSGLGSLLVLQDSRLHNAPPTQEHNPTGYYNNTSLGLPDNFDTRLVPLLADPLHANTFPQWP